MPRKRPDRGLDDLVAAAARVFTRMGFRRAQMADIAKAMGVSAGTLYGYVESKEALFDLTVQRIFPGEPTAAPELPFRGQPQEDLLSQVEERLSPSGAPALGAALERKAPVAEEVREEVGAILGELYDFMSANRRGLALIDRTALDRPDLAAIYYERGRRGLLERIERYLRLRTSAGLLEALPDTALAARLLLETIAWFTIHRQNDFDGSAYDDHLAKQTVIAMLTRALSRNNS